MEHQQLLQHLWQAMEATGYAPKVHVVVGPAHMNAQPEIFETTVPGLLQQICGGLDPRNIVYQGDDGRKARLVHDTLVKAYTHIQGIVSSESTDDDEDEADGTVECSICHQSTNAMTAHRHQDRWIGDDCCWDERLRASE